MYFEPLNRLTLFKQSALSVEHESCQTLKITLSLCFISVYLFMECGGKAPVARKAE